MRRRDCEPCTPTSVSALVENAAAPSLADLARASLKIGCLGFGGPAGQIALMHRIFVEEHQWIDEGHYLHALNYCMLLPGPEAQQLATYVGWLLHGVRGGVLAGALFVLPGALVVFALAWLYALHGQAPVVAALFLGVKAAVLAFIADALVRIGRRALKSRIDASIALAALVALYLFGVPFPLVIVSAGVTGAMLIEREPAHEMAAMSPAVSMRQTTATAALWGAAWLGPVAVIFVTAGPAHLLGQISLLFSKLAVVTFGGAYAVLAYLQQQAVDVHGWLTAGQMIDGLGLAETTPGPLILVNQFVGFLAGWQADGGGPGLAVACAVLASWCTFAPSFLWIFAGAPHAERLRRNRYAVGALRAITAAVLGVILSLAIWFGQHVLFSASRAVCTPWNRVLDVPSLPSIDWIAALIALGAAVGLIRYRLGAVTVVVASALAGLASGSMFAD